MRFPYVEREVDPLPGEVGRQVVHEPVVLVRFIGPAKTYAIKGLVDTGASMTLLPRSYMARLGVATEGRGRVGTAAGGLPVLIGSLDLEIGRGRSARRWSARVGFVHRADNLALLGHDGFLDHFRATFDGPARTINLNPTGTFPAPRIDDTR